MTIEFQSESEAVYDAIQSYKRRIAKYGKKYCTDTKSIGETIRALDRVTGANYASKALLAQTSFPIVNGIKWSKRNKVGGMFEHANPVAETRNYLMKNNLSLEETIEYLWNEYVVCWITYEENARLNALKYGSKRPGGWIKCYTEAGIEPIKLK